jgi:hypothetical protein
VILGVSLCAGCGSSKAAIPPAPTHILNGTMALAADGTGTAGDPCAGSGGYSDITPGAQVAVADQAGTVLAVGQLDGGRSDGRYGCDFDFAIPGVGPATVYEVTVSHRGAVDFTIAQMEADSWMVQLSLGS